MEEFGSFWTYHENIDELKQKLLYTSIELESVKMEANEALKKHKEEIKQLLNLIKLACQERHEAKDQLQQLLNKLISSSPTELQPVIQHIQNETPIGVLPTKPNSRITEFKSLSDTYNQHQSHGSSPADFFLDVVSFPEYYSNINMAGSGNMVGYVNQPFVQDYSRSISTSLVSSRIVMADPADVVFESLAKRKILPQPGKLLQTVMECGPLLQTILAAGPLRRWRNSPPLQPFKIPPLSIEGCENMNISHKPSPNSTSVPQKSLNSTLSSYRMSSQMCSTSMLNFSNCPSGSAQASGLLFTSGSGFNNQIPFAKRQKLFN